MPRAVCGSKGRFDHAVKRERSYITWYVQENKWYVRIIRARVWKCPGIVLSHYHHVLADVAPVFL
jgi:hypothetical protein